MHTSNNQHQTEQPTTSSCFFYSYREILLSLITSLLSLSWFRNRSSSFSLCFMLVLCLFFTLCPRNCRNKLKLLYEIYSYSHKHLLCKNCSNKRNDRCFMFLFFCIERYITVCSVPCSSDGSSYPAIMLSFQLTFGEVSAEV